MEIKFSDITVVVQGAVYEGITARAVESVRRFLPGARVVLRRACRVTCRRAERMSERKGAERQKPERVSRRKRSE